MLIITSLEILVELQNLIERQPPPQKKQNQKKQTAKLRIFYERPEEAVWHECDSDTSWCTWNDPQRLGKLEVRARIETIQTVALLRLARILKRVLVWRQWKKNHLKLVWKTCLILIVNHAISEFSKLAQKELKSRRNLLGKMIHLELWKRLEFDHTNKWYMYKPESVLENEIHEILWDFEVQTDNSIPAWRLDLELINQKNLSSSGPSSRNERNRKE